MRANKKSREFSTLALSSYIKLMRAAESVTARTHRHLALDKLTFSQFAVIEALYNLGPLNQKSLSQKILKSQRNITMVIDNLEKRNLVRRERDAEDRRNNNVYLTKSGETLFKKIIPRHIEGMVEEMGILTESELEELSRLCRIVGKKERK